MTQRIVNQLETVEVEEQNRAACLLPVTHPLQGRLEVLHEHSPIGEPGQAVFLRCLDQGEFHSQAPASDPVILESCDDYQQARCGEPQQCTQQEQSKTDNDKTHNNIQAD